MWRLQTGIPVGAINLASFRYKTAQGAIMAKSRKVSVKPEHIAKKRTKHSTKASRKRTALKK
jgi:hypothetical protein